MKKSSIAIIVILCVIGFAVFCILLGSFACTIGTSSVSLGTSSLSLNAPEIAAIHIDGEISSESSDVYNHSWLMNTLDELIENKSNSAIVLVLDTPGGTIYECDEIYNKLLEYKQTERPVYTSMSAMAASGGYYIASLSDKIFANRNCLTGSLGVTMGSIIDITGLLEKNGIRVTNIVSGKNKAMGSMLEPLTDEQIAIFTSLTDDAYEQFVDVIVKGRSLEIGYVKSLADGRLYTAKQALANKLIDRIGTFDDAISDLCLNYNLSGSLEHLYYTRKPSFFETLMQTSTSTDSLIDAAAHSIRLPSYLAPIAYNN